jgi:hypothetical protein
VLSRHSSGPTLHSVADGTQILLSIPDESRNTVLASYPLLCKISRRQVARRSSCLLLSVSRWRSRSAKPRKPRRPTPRSSRRLSSRRLLAIWETENDAYTTDRERWRFRRLLRRARTDVVVRWLCSRSRYRRGWEAASIELLQIAHYIEYSLAHATLMNFYLVIENA